MHSHVRPGTTDEKILQTKTFYAKELKGLAYIIGMMNMILHGIESPNIVKTNTLAQNIADIQPSDQVDVIGANPPYGGAERKEIQQNFPIKTSETAYMFMQHFIKMLKPGGRAGIVIKNTFLSNTDNASIALRRKLITECNLTTVLDLPQGVFAGTGVRTVVLFFKKGEPTKKVWYYQLDKHFTKTHPLKESDLADFLNLQKSKSESENSWTIDVKDLDDNLDMSVKNPNKVEETDNRTPNEIAEELIKLNSDNTLLLKQIKELL
jgi:type I restriction enzyme M protein